MFDNRVSELVKKEIIQNAMSGEKYITEADLCFRAKVSRTKLRETLKTLDHDGMIERKQKCGVALRRYNREEIKELFSLRIMLESKVAEKTVANATERDIFELQQLDNEVEIAVKLNDKIEAVIKDALFHKKLIQISGGKILLRAVNSLQLLENSMKNLLPHKISPAKRDPYTHVDMIRAIKNRDTKTYKKLLVNHIKWVARKVLELQ